MTSYLIIGAGNFGAATALTLAKREGATKVTLVDTADFPNPRAASHDVSKIVRDDYPDKLYMQLLKKAMPLWRNHDLYKTWYHQVGMLRADPSDFGEQSIASYKEVGVENSSHFLTVKEVRQRWNGSFATANFDGLEKILFNPTVGFAEADKALGAVVQEAVDRGVKYVVGVVAKINIGAAGECTGVTLRSGDTLHADKTLLAAGARTAALLVQSAPENQQFHAGDRLLATGAVSFYAKLQGAQKEKLSSIPVLKNCLPHVKGEGLSILADGTIKFNCDMCFTNYVDCPFTGQRLSMAPEEGVYNLWTGPKFIKLFQERARKTLDGLYGKEVEDVAIDAYRMCWDASTPTHDFLITPHPHSHGLYVATGGSFHGWKFLPVIGDYIADMMHGSLETEFAERWAWDKKGGDGHSANPTYQIVGDLQDWLS
ncbi:sarcosine oxidase [Metarhizium album ARSEF 1941]|uniref:Sarcosine oxidase n=1 Tax=Metarhizium album (strain ARSEF 1941) TaxID=1081103 RepID=A0A0B2X8T4_METAS|nr:sarcosine oxidase [Metarhizium album ARSEF 1941]KHO01706.1 sarcosine oxidase [Metarhizium album ARSEF 1941]